MKNGKIFGTDGIRGMANRYPMTPEVAMSLGQALAHYFSSHCGKGKVVIGKDTRRSSYMLELAVSAGVSSMGSQAILTGPLPTPGIAFLTRAMRADAGIVISASHNRFYDNGIKFFDANGFKFPDKIEDQIEKFVLSKPNLDIRPTHEKIGRAIRIEDAVGRYIEFLKSTFPKQKNLKGLRVVVDCANGAAYEVAPQLLEEMDAEVFPINISPNGSNINQGCGALHPEDLSKKVVELRADIGIALDGDADRLIISDEKGNILDGDNILAICALYLKGKEKLKRNTVVGTIMTNMGLELFLRERGIQLIRTQVGDRYIMEALRENNFSLGGEPSGHLIFSDISTTGDGLLAALQILAIMNEVDKPLSEVIDQLPIYPQITKNIPVTDRKDLSNIKQIQNEIRVIEQECKGKGRVVLRYSGTEPLLRLMVEAEDSKSCDQYIDRLSHCIQEYI